MKREAILDLDSPELRDLGLRAREITERVVAPVAAELDDSAGWPRGVMRELGAAGLLGLNAPVDVGGLGAGLEGLVVVAREIAHESPSAALCYAMHCVGTAVIAAKATDFQRQHYLRPIAEGRHITTLALSEPGTGSEFWIPQTTLQREDGALVLHGTKSFVTNGGEADSYVVSTVAAPGTAPGAEGAFSCVLVDADSPNLVWKDSWTGFGMRSNSSRTAALEGVRVPESQLLGVEGDQLWYVFEVIAPFFLTAMAGTYLGIAEACVELAREHLGTRRHAHTGELLGSEPVLAHELGEIWLAVDMARQTMISAVRRADAGDADALVAIFGSKVAAVEAAVDAANRAMTLCGGMAYRENSKLARMLRDARAGHVMSPTTHILKTWIGRALLKLPLL